MCAAGRDPADDERGIDPMRKRVKPLRGSPGKRAWEMVVRCSDMAGQICTRAETARGKG